MKKRSQQYFNQKRIKKIARYFAYFDLSAPNMPNKTVFFSYKCDSGKIVKIEVDMGEEVVVPITKECYDYTSIT